MTVTTLCKQQKREMISRFGHSNDFIGLSHLLTTLLPLGLLWWMALRSAPRSPWITVAAVPLISLFTLRVFALMHECGHGSLFRSATLNRRAGFLLGVLSGMPQFVWAQNHNFHHAHNGNWERYRGPYTTLSVSEYAALSPRQQRLYRLKCNPAAAPIAGFIYLIFNPRFNWIIGNLAWLRHVLGAKLTRPRLPLRERAAEYRSRRWKSSREYWHMTGNNVALLCAWVLMSRAWGALPFFGVYLVSLSIAGGLGIVLFTVQHNFEHAYASGSENWDHDTGAIKGTSYLVLPRWLDWFTANIGYHHIHHLSPRIPGYHLAQCHREYEHLFTEVVRLKLSQVLRSMDCILWDAAARRIIPLSEYRDGSMVPLGARPGLES